MRYFQRGGKCVSEPVGILSGYVLHFRSSVDDFYQCAVPSLIPSPLVLMRHFFAVAFYAIYIMWTTPDAKTGKTRSLFGNVVKGVSVVSLSLLYCRLLCCRRPPSCTTS